MKAGRELDALVDKYVMGCSGVGSPFYSTRIEDAWKVVEKIQPAWVRIEPGEEKNWGADLAFDVHAQTGGYICRGYAEADTVPLAICLAALEAIDERLD